MGIVATCFGKLIDVGEAQTLAGRSLLEERYRALQRQIPLLYLIALANFIGLHFATTGVRSFLSASSLLAALVVVRLVHWVRTRHRVPPPERIRRELKKTFAFAFAFCVGFCAWGIYQMEGSASDQRAYIILFGAM